MGGGGERKSAEEDHHVTVLHRVAASDLERECEGVTV